MRDHGDGEDGEENGEDWGKWVSIGNRGLMEWRFIIFSRLFLLMSQEDRWID